MRRHLRRRYGRAIKSRTRFESRASGRQVYVTSATKDYVLFKFAGGDMGGLSGGMSRAEFARQYRRVR